MPRLRPALAALLTALALPTAAAPAPAPTATSAPVAKGATATAPAPAPAAPAASSNPLLLHLAIGTGICARPHSDVDRVDNPCWLQVGVAPSVQVGHLELGLAYEGRELVKLITFGLVKPPSVMTLGATAAWVHEPSERWRLTAGAEAGWRRYLDFAGSGMRSREGAADTAYLGALGRAALGLRPQSGRTDRLEVSLAIRSDLKTAHATVDGVPWQAGGWSMTMSIGLVSEW